MCSINDLVNIYCRDTRQVNLGDHSTPPLHGSEIISNTFNKVHKQDPDSVIREISNTVINTSKIRVVSLDTWWVGCVVSESRIKE